MSIITAHRAQRQARDALFADYADEHVSNYTEAALTYSEHRERALRIADLLLIIAAFGLSLYNFTLLWRGRADLALVGLTFGGLLAAFVVRRWRRETEAATIRTINATVLMASYEHAPTDVILRQRPPETGDPS